MTHWRAPLMLSLRVPQIAAITLMMLCACTQKSVTATWIEDVQLANGQFLEVERKETSNTTGQLGQGIQHYLASATLRPRAPVGGAWLTSEWTAPVRPLVLDFDETSHEFVIVGVPDLCHIYERLRAPDSMYVEYRFRQGVWQQVPLSAFSQGHAANLLLTVRPAAEAGHISLAEKLKRDGVPGVYPPYRSIDPKRGNPCRRQ